MRNLIFTGVALFFSFCIYAQSFSGYVFEDANQNGQRDRKEKGIPKVSVTNGIQVVQTDRKGRYELPGGKDNIIAVIKPSGYNVEVGENQLPHFFYIHKPEGSPDLKYEGVKPTGKLPRRINFPLVKDEVKNEFKMILFGDPQAYTEQEVEFYRDGIVTELRGIEGYEFGMSLGDLVGNRPDLFNPYSEATSEIGVPWYNVIGNHDINFDVEVDSLSDESFEAHFGPANYAFNYGKVHFIVLDNVIFPDPRDGKGYYGGLNDNQLSFVENNLKFVPKDHLVVLAFHIPIYIEPAFNPEDRVRLFEILKDYPHTLSVSAHTHRQNHFFLGEDMGWLQEKPHHHYNAGTTSGDWYSGKLNESGVPLATMRDGTPKGYALIKFEGNDYTIDYKVAGKPIDYRMEIFNPKVVATGRKSQAGIFVNFFMGSEKDTVMYRIDGSEWKIMQYVKEFDPSYVKTVYEWDLADNLMPGRRPSNPVNSTHLWRGKIPTDIGIGEHLIEVKVTDMFGRVFTDTSTYRLANPL